MTDNQFREIVDKMTKCVNGIQELRSDVAELKVGQAKLEEGQAKLEEGQAKLEKGQARLEKETQKIAKAITILTEDSLKTRVKVGLLEDKIELSN